MKTPESCADIRRNLCRKCAALNLPVSGIFELTPRCNLSCKMCYIRMTPEEMAPIGKEKTAKEWISLGKEARDAGMVFLLITGGEPTLRPDFPEIYRALAQMGLSISINTNGTLITDEIKEVFKELPPAQINLTLYGVSPEDYADFCSNGNAFYAVKDALDWFEKENILVHLNATFTPSNYTKWTKLEDFAKDRNLELRATCYCFPPTRRNDCDDCNGFARLTPEAAGSVMAEEILYRMGPDAILRRSENISSPLQKSCDLDNGEPMQCLAGRAQFWIAWEGSMTPCGMLSTPRTAPFEYGFESAWKQLCKSVSDIRLCAECNNCEHRDVCMNCAAVTYAETGRFEGKPEYMCEMIKSYRNTINAIADKIRKKNQ